MLNTNGFTATQLARALDPDTLELIILPTEKCNFRCTYCYEDFKLGRMSPDLVHGVKNLLERRAKGLRNLRLSWFGGEPLLAKDIVLDISSFGKTLSEKFGFNFEGSLTANGFLLDPSLLCKLTKENQKYFQISLDGDAAAHDKTRLLANGNGSFQKIVNNLISARDSKCDFFITLRLHVHNNNSESILRLVDFIRCEFLEDSRFEIFFHRIENLGGNGGSGGMEILMSDSDYAEFIKSIPELDTRSHEPKRARSELHLDNYICYASKPNSLLIRSDGRIGKCTVLLSDPRNDVGRLSEDGTLKFNQPALQGWLEGFRNFEHTVLSCPASALPPIKESSNKTINATLVE